jgi:hypothetical protein
MFYPLTGSMVLDKGTSLAIESAKTASQWSILKGYGTRKGIGSSLYFSDSCHLPPFS